MSNTRKKFLQQVGASFLMTGLPAIASAGDIFASAIDVNDFKSDGDPDDEKYWKRIANNYYNVS